MKIRNYLQHYDLNDCKNDSKITLRIIVRMNFNDCKNDCETNARMIIRIIINMNNTMIFSITILMTVRIDVILPQE
jgi:hypothetical protein